jgi:phosphatidylserine/phosphatidylglycerophosphate/cardiolipin synthase-like enzyme
MPAQAAFSRTSSIAELIRSAIQQSVQRVDAALYRFNNAALAESLAQRVGEGIELRLVLDGGKYESDARARELLARFRLSFRLLHGRGDPGSKLHHKFAIVDRRILLTGSYNWTLDSENENYEGLLIVEDPALVESYQEEFEALWTAAVKSL